VRANPPQSPRTDSLDSVCGFPPLGVRLPSASTTEAASAAFPESQITSASPAPTDPG
jgi:hypothetical protein